MATIKPLDIYLDFYTKDIVSIPCTQYDRDARTLIIHLLNNGKIFNLDPSVHQLNFKMDKEDGNVVFNSCVINSDGTATYVLTEQTCVNAGVYGVQFMLVYAGNQSVVHTMPARLIVTQSVADNIQIESSSEFSALNEALLKVSTFDVRTITTEEIDLLFN